ncbi:hypothetical protein QDA04_gp75 [Microbacterium phage Megan]|uniref:Uncharacterized protein n=1 Tax=Microbacterium phage Megan TaxID=2656551 RepID=A0A649VKU1_9CAUD|nr:hypothetical protein QDA04_gp75 [Microbacterium phage Megan]QGJ92745.1 hypothetical protein PBI_MEGAN_75 [Microbacterium phage Megan]
MPIANYTTSVPVVRTVDAITKMLGGAGASSITQHLGPNLRPVGVEFGITTEVGWRPYRLPVRIEAVERALAADPPPKPSQRTPEHAERVAWRIAHDWLRAQLALIEAGMATLDEVMFPYVLVSADTTAYEAFGRKQVTS